MVHHQYAKSHSLIQQLVYLTTYRTLYFCVLYVYIFMKHMRLYVRMYLKHIHSNTCIIWTPLLRTPLMDTSITNSSIMDSFIMDAFIMDLPVLRTPKLLYNIRIYIYQLCPSQAGCAANTITLFLNHFGRQPEVI